MVATRSRSRSRDPTPHPPQTSNHAVKGKQKAAQHTHLMDPSDNAISLDEEEIDQLMSDSDNGKLHDKKAASPELESILLKKRRGNGAGPARGLEAQSSSMDEDDESKDDKKVHFQTDGKAPVSRAVVIFWCFVWC